MRKKKIQYVDTRVPLPFDLRSEAGRIAKENGKMRDEMLRIWIEQGILTEKKIKRRSR